MAQKQHKNTKFTFKNESDYPFLKNDREFRDIVEELKGTDSELKRNDMITKLIDRIMKSFKVTALCFNQKNRTIEMHTIPKTAVVFTYTSEQAGFSVERQNFGGNLGTMRFTIDKHAGTESQNINLSYKNQNRIGYWNINGSYNWNTRIDNLFREQGRAFSFSQTLPGTNFGLGRIVLGFGAKSRSNTIDHQQFGKQKKLFSGPADNNDNLLKTSDLLGASILFKKFSPYATMKCGIYGDIDNKFLFSQVTLDLSKLISISNSYSLSLVAKFSEVSGYNIFKNDLLNRHSRIWVDDRTKNYLKARADLAFLKFPILSNFNLIPRLYFESWATFGKIAGKLTTNWEGELGINIFRSENIWIDFALLQMSRKRREGYAPTIRFQF